MTSSEMPIWGYALLGAGVGAVGGALVGLRAARRVSAPASAGGSAGSMAESVESLKRRAEQILAELSDAAPVPPKETNS